MSQTQFNQLGSCEVRRLTQLSSTDFIWSGWGVFHAWPAVKNAWRPTLGQTPISHEPNHTHNQWWLNLVHVNVWISLKCMNQPRSQFFFQHGCLYFQPERAYYICMLTYFTTSVLVTVIVNCTAGETLILSWKTTAQQDRFFISLV